LLGAGISSWFWQRSEKKHWAREQAIPEIAKLTNQKKPLAALRLLQQAQEYLPRDPQLDQITDGLMKVVSVRSSPSGAAVAIKDYLSPDDVWFPLGTTPLENIKIPAGYYRWRLSKPGLGEQVSAPMVEDIHGYFHEFNFALDAAAFAPDGMVAVPAVKFTDYVWSLGLIGPFDLPLFYIDRYEVTNRKFQEFVDKGGYERREYWKERFVRDGLPLTWEQGQALLRDSTGRPGPSTWEQGHYPQGQADYPVNGVSWYEAAAYAEFAGKSLPVMAQWYRAAPASVGHFIVPMSNFSLMSPAPRGKYNGLGPWGTYDMAGNLAEWCWNEAGSGNRFNPGGAWNTSSSDYAEPGASPPFSRSRGNGFRCVRNVAPVPPETKNERRIETRDITKAKPVEDAAFRIYKAMYAYDRTLLNAREEPVKQDSAEWQKEKITFDAAYGKERVTAYLLKPVTGRPPYQTVVFFPSARVEDLPDSNKLGDLQFIDYVIKSGRAVLYPVYKGTYDRTAPESGMATNAARETMIQQSKDLGRSIDYLETRADIDHSKIGYLGVSMGAAQGVIFTSVEDRFKVVVFLDGGFTDERPLPGTDQADFAPRLKAPVLMIGGRYDFVLEGKDMLFRMIGTSIADKKVVTLETAHDVSEQRTDLTREVIAWLDKYLGRVH
jgi:dienelactone hydrolase